MRFRRQRFFGVQDDLSGASFQFRQILFLSTTDVPESIAVFALAKGSYGVKKMMIISLSLL